jgi:ABC-2 type transport system permease protein
MSKINQIIEREYMSRVRKKSFLVLTFLVPVLLIALVFVPFLLSMMNGSDVKQVAVADYSGLYGSRLEGNEQYQFTLGKDNLANFRKDAMNNDDIHALLVIEGNLSGDSGKVTLYARKQVELDLKTFITGQLETLAKKDKIASFNIPELESIIQKTDVRLAVNTFTWEEDGSEKKSSSELAMIIGMICTFAIYIFIFAYGALVMNGVIEEKANRIVEIIVSSVRPFELMMGKIIGIAMVGLTQVLLWVLLIAGIAGIASTYVGKSMDTEKMQAISQGMTANPSLNLPGQTMSPDDMSGLSEGITSNPQIMDIIEVAGNLNLGELAIWFILFFLGGYLLYASLFAAVGSAIDNQEDAQQFTLPLTIPVLFALYAGMASANNPDGPLAFWCSIIPFTSPIVMMVRIPFGVPFWQLLLSFGLLVITFLLTTLMASKIYRTGILMYGKKVTYKELWKWLTYKS